MTDLKTKPKTEISGKCVQTDPQTSDSNESKNKNPNQRHFGCHRSRQSVNGFVESNGFFRSESNSQTIQAFTQLNAIQMYNNFNYIPNSQPFYGLPQPYPTLGYGYNRYPNPRFNANARVNPKPNLWRRNPNSLPNPNPRPHTSARNCHQMKNSQHLSEKEIREKVLKYRSFHLKDSSGSDNSKGFEFSLMTYNILSQNLLEDHSSLYTHCQPSSTQWSQRGQRIVRELLESEADIICLQEVHSENFNELLVPALKAKGYNFVYKRKTGDKQDGCAIVYREDMFTVLKTIKLELMRKDLSSLLDRDNIGLIVEFMPKGVKDSTSIIVATTHLLYNPRRGDIKIAQIRLLMAEIDKLALIERTDESFDYKSIILCGDLNSEYNSMLYNFITNGSANFGGLKVGDISGQKDGYGKGRDVESHHLELLGVTSDTRFEGNDDKSERERKMTVKHNFKFKSVYERVCNKFGDKFVSTSNRFESSLVDYIFYDFRKLKLLGKQRLLTEKQMKEIGNIPNDYLGSDHLALKAKFRIK